MPDFSQETLLDQLGSSATNKVVERLRRFAFSSWNLLSGLSEQALNENWGEGGYVLEKYLAVHLGWSIEQGNFTYSERQLFVTAGHLQTRYGTPLYLVFEPNEPGRSQPWLLRYAGSRPSMPTAPASPDIPAPAPLPNGAEIVMSHDHILDDNAERVGFLNGTPRVAQMCAVAGAIQWSLNRGLHFPYWYYGRMNHLVPLYLKSRENITLAPDLVAPIEVHRDSLLVRTVMLPHMPYPNARVAVRRHDQLPPWLLNAWNLESASVKEAAVDDPES